MNKEMSKIVDCILAIVFVVSLIYLTSSIWEKYYVH